MRFFYLKTLCFILLLTPTAFADSTTEGMPSASFADQHVYPFFEKAVDQNSQFILAAGVASVAIVNPQDDQIRSDWKNYHYMTKNTAQVGDFLGSGAAGVLALGGQYFFDGERDHWLSHARALVWSTVFSSALKFSFGRPRPGNSDDHHSFPSGHSTTAFTTATSLTYAYGWKAAMVAYPLATFVGLSRLSDDVHWGSDVVAGAFVGFWAARASYYSTQDIVEEKRKSVFLPVVGPGQLGAQWIYTY